MGLFTQKTKVVSADQALPGREEAIEVPDRHFVLGTPLAAVPGGHRERRVRHGLLLGRRADVLAGARRVHDGGRLRRRRHAEPDIREVCSGMTGHTEVVLVVFDPSETSYEEMLRIFWEGHDPTQGMRQGNDVGTQYRSAIYTDSDEQRAAAERSKRDVPGGARREGLRRDHDGDPRRAGPFYYAEDYHQQYLAKNPNGYCGLGGTGVSCPVGLVRTETAA